jgi:molecular chaperone DnaK (HSP70)
VPSRLVASAKSWLAHGDVDRTAPILPFGHEIGEPGVSPLDASTRYLSHIRDAWNHELARADAALRLEAQQLVLTVPASFDDEARELTAEAARRAGLGRVTLVEEPIAALYAWLTRGGGGRRGRLAPGALVLVCDVGGGTTDFSLIRAGDTGDGAGFERIAIGEHLLLGGDNLDLALARLLQQRLEAAGHKVDTWQLHGLWHQCRLAKESLLGDPSQKERAVTLLGRGSKLIGGSVTTSLSVDDVNQVLVDGFFPAVGSSDMPVRARRVGLQELGLPYAADAAVTRHLARFLSRQTSDATGSAPIRRGPSGIACPTHVLFNGGVMKADALRARVIDVLSRWLVQEGFAALDERHVLDAPDLDRAVACGAAYYGLARHGRGIRIRSGAPRTYYVGIESAMPSVPGLPPPVKALCVVPFGMEEGASATIAPLEFALTVGEPAEFRFFSSAVRKSDPVGVMIEDFGEDLEELSSLDVTLQVEGREGATVPVTLESRMTEIGTIELWCVARDAAQRWKLELSIRDPDAD